MNNTPVKNTINKNIIVNNNKNFVTSKPNSRNIVTEKSLLIKNRTTLKSIKLKKSKKVFDLKDNIFKTVEILYAWLEELNEVKTSNKKIIKKVNSMKKKTLYLLNKRIKFLEDIEYPENLIVKEVNKNLILKVDHVNKYYSSKKMAIKILDDISFEIEDGDFAVILGPSGSGKTTLMNLISGMDKTTYGKVWVNGYHLEEMDSDSLTVFRKNNIGYVFQRYGLLPNLTVFENVLMGSYLGKNLNKHSDNKIYKNTSYSKSELKEMNLRDKKNSNISKKEENEKIKNILKSLELLNYSNKYPYELSGGQKQRVSIARTIAKNPKIIYGDEPTGAVDSQMSKTIIDSFAKVNNELKTTVVMITHDESIANYANKVIYLLDGKIDRIIYKQKGEILVK